MTSTITSPFSPPIRTWFEQTFGQPTPPQAQGWPAIQRGEHTLILAPTGSGKTLAAFLWGIDALYRELTEDGAAPGVRLLYISPLKALNNDIHRNLRTPLAGIRKKAGEIGEPFPEIRVTVRSGDTPQRERQAMLRQPPHIVITTPESLYLLLTSPKARDMFRGVRTVIVDEIHTLVGTKRGVHLSLSLERLAHLAQGPVQRIGLSATIRPLDEVARFLGGAEWRDGADTGGLTVPGEQKIVAAKAAISREGDGTPGPMAESRVLVPRPVTVVDAHYRKPLDLKVLMPVAEFRSLPGGSVWPSIIPRVVDLVRQHRTTLIFCNSRRLAERTADRINEQTAAEAEGRASGLIEDGISRGGGFLAAGTGTHPNPIRAHHGSMSREARLEMERDLKGGSLPALVATSSLELGIDIGSVDLVVQLQSPKSVAQGLQRVGRSGHLVGETSKGRIFPTHREDVMEAAAVAGGMLRGEVEPTYTPRVPLDVLAQQIVAMVSVESWDVDAAYDLVRQAYAYADLSPRVYRTVLEMLAGRYPSEAHRELRARVDWDRVNNRLAALPGSRLMATSSGGTIPDRGSFNAYLSDGKTRLGELDEEFVFETRVGDAFMLGSQVWRVTGITDDRVTVKEAPGSVPRMPFWRGDYPWRPYELGVRVGEFRRLVAEKVRLLGDDRLTAEDAEDVEKEPENVSDSSGSLRVDFSRLQPVLDWLQHDYALDENSARQVVDYVAGQLDTAGAISSDETVLVEVFDDALGDPRLVVHSPFGGRVNGPWGLALADALRERTGVEVEVQTNDDGILLRFPNSDAEFPLDIVSEIGPDEARERILRSLPDSAVFGAQFRQNAARALLLPGSRPGKRTPFWLQRLRARDLLQVVRNFDDFPILIETYRDCLQDVMDLRHLEEVLGDIRDGRVEVVTIESATPSPVAASLLNQLIGIFMYEGDAPRAERQLQQLAVDRTLLQELLRDVALDEFLKPEAIDDVTARLQHAAPTARARSAEELAVVFDQVGDLSLAEVEARAAAEPAAWLQQLAAQGRIRQIQVPTRRGLDTRWVGAEGAADYEAAFGGSSSTPLLVPTQPEVGEQTPAGPSLDLARRAILARFLRQAGPLTVDDIRGRYAFPEEWLREELDRLVEAGEVAHGRFTAGAPADQYLDRHALEQIHRHTLTLLRREVQPVPFAAYAAFLADWQHLSAARRFAGHAGLVRVLQQLRALPVVGRVWERDVLPLRLERYDPAELDAMCQGGELIWVGSGGVDPRRSRVRFVFRGEGHVYLDPPPQDLEALSPAGRTVYDALKSEGAVFFADLQSALDLPVDGLEPALIELVMAGLVTNDSLEALRHLLQAAIAGPRGAEGHKPWSTLEADLARRRPPSSPSGSSSTARGGGVGRGTSSRRPGPAQLRAARRRIAERLGQAATPRQAGRWSLVHRLGVMGREIPAEEKAARRTRQLLQRWGVVTRETLDLEETGWDWAAIYSQLRLMEMRGEVRRGYFVSGLPGVQFALPDVVEELRARRDPGAGDAEPIVLNACDPANLYGAQMDGGPLTAGGAPLTFARLPSTWLVQERGYPVLLAEGGGATLTTVQGADEAAIRRALRALLAHLARTEHRMVVETWNGERVLDSPGQELLESLGFYREYPAMVWERGAA